MIFSSPGTAKTPGPFLPTALSICFESESKTDATCLRESAVDSAILVRISLLVADFAVVAIALLSLAKRLEIPFTRAEVCMKQGDFASLSWFRAWFFLQNMQNHREFRLQQRNQQMRVHLDNYASCPWNFLERADDFSKNSAYFSPGASHSCLCRRRPCRQLAAIPRAKRRWNYAGQESTDQVGRQGS